MEPAQALADLAEISSQLQAAVIVDGDGSVLASTLGDETRARALAAAAQELLSSAQHVKGGSGEPLVQLEAATLAGSVFVVREGDRFIVATTSPEPTVGLVFYDLKSCLRAAAAVQGDGKPRPAARRKSVAKENGAGS